MNTEIILSIVNALLVSGGLVTLASIRWTAKKAKSDAKEAETDANTKLMTAFEEHVLQPVTESNGKLKSQVEELNGTVAELRKETTSLRNEVRRLRKAVDKIEDCPSAHDCPVRLELQKQSARDGEGTD